MNDEIIDPTDRQAEIYRRLKAGERGSHIARAVGVSRQYVSFLAKKWAVTEVTPAPTGAVHRPKIQEPIREPAGPPPTATVPARSSIPEVREFSSPFAPRRRGRPRKGEEVTSPQTMTPAMLEQMARSNAAVAQMMARARNEKDPAPAQPPETDTGTVGTPVRLGPKLGRNDPCPLDPQKKFKRCCGAMGATRCQKAPVPGEGAS